MARSPAANRAEGGRRAKGERPAAPLTEADLARVWEGQRLPAAVLVTREGLPVRVLNPGRAPGGPGPDFRDALLVGLADRPLHGDVELHLRSSDFRAHGHHRDHRYDRLILHLVVEDDAPQPPRLASGRPLPVVALAPWLVRRAAELASWLGHPALWREPCQDAVLRLGEGAVRAILDRLGDERFERRAKQLAVTTEGSGAEEALYRAFLEGLGYGGDRRLFSAVAEALPWSELKACLARAEPAERLELAEALLLGSAGLLPSQQGRPPGAERETRWEERWSQEERGGPRPSGMPLGSLRPANHPARRLAGLARLLARHGPELAAIRLDSRPRELVAAWSAPADGYWRCWTAPGLPTVRPAGALIGRGRAIELLVNAVLPWAAARAGVCEDDDGAQLVREQFAALPAPGAYGRLRFLLRNLRTDEGRPLQLNARRQQGLLALYKDECTQGGCGRCPLS